MPLIPPDEEIRHNGFDVALVSPYHAHMSGILGDTGRELQVCRAFLEP